MKLTKFVFTVLLLAVLLSCKKDPNEYRMENKDFVAPVYYEQLYQRELNKKIAAIQGDLPLNAFAQKRLVAIESYLTELNARTKTEDRPAPGSLPGDKVQKLTEVSTPIAGHKTKLIELLKISDQDMIGFHVKASGSAGLKEQALRDWSNDKLKTLLENLNEIQNIK